MSWAWEDEPSEDQLVGGAPPALVAEVEKKADELVRFAAGGGCGPLPGWHGLPGALPSL
ncbi:hypothetical protein AB0G77_26240 [Streptomyces hygroscopicus]|uniref:hypothetical protein n=1 Tax=Streptomyces hygroscopicus TaxID=1912 RepID=UPI0033EB92DB